MMKLPIYGKMMFETTNQTKFKSPTSQYNKVSFFLNCVLFNGHSAMEQCFKRLIMDMSHKPYVFHVYWNNMQLSINGGTPKSSILIGLSLMNHPFWGTPIYGSPHIKKCSAFMENRFLFQIPGRCPPYYGLKTKEIWGLSCLAQTSLG